MKKINIFIISTLILSIILAFPGCIGGNKKGNESPARIKIFEVLGGVAYVPDLNQKGIVFADSISEIGDQYTVFVGNNSESVVPMIQAFCYDDAGKVLNIPVVFTKDTVNFDDCYNMDSPRDLEGGGSAFNLVGVAPGGKGKLIASANGLMREVEVYIYNSFGSLNTGLNVVTREQVPQDDPSSTIYGDTSGATIRRLNKRSYAIPDGICDGFTWKEKLRAVKSVDTSKFIDGSEGQALEGPECPQPQIFIAEAAGGGYIKVVKVGVSIVWEYSPTTNFK